MLGQNLRHSLVGAIRHSFAAGLLPLLARLTVAQRRDELLAFEELHGVALAEEVTTGANPVYHVQRQCHLVDVNALQDPVKSPDDLVVNDQALLADGQCALHRARVEDLVDTTQHGHREHCRLLVACLDVEQLRVGGRGGAPARDVVEMGDLRAGDVDQPHLDCADSDAPHAHVHNRATGAVPDGVARIGELDDGDAADDVGRLLSQQPCQCHR